MNLEFIDISIMVGKVDEWCVFEDWYVVSVFDYVVNLFGSCECYLMWKVWQVCVDFIGEVKL